MSDNIILFPEIEKLKTEISSLKARISELLCMRDQMLFVECKNIEMEYMLALGDLEYKAYELNCHMLRLKRKAELIQACKNRQEKIILSEIENILDTEFADYQARLDEQLHKMNRAMERSRGEWLSEDELQEARKLYHDIVKALHPDLHPELGPEKLELFHNAVSAYERGDIKSLRLISVMVSGSDTVDQEKDKTAALTRERDRLKELVTDLQEQIEKITKEYPYTVRPIIRNKQKITEKRAELSGLIEQLDQAIEAYEMRIKEMLR